MLAGNRETVRLGESREKQRTSGAGAVWRSSREKGNSEKELQVGRTSEGLRN